MSGLQVSIYCSIQLTIMGVALVFPDNLCNSFCLASLAFDAVTKVVVIPDVISTRY